MAEPRVTIRSDRTKGIPRIMALANARALKRAIISTRAYLSSALNKETGVRVKTIKGHIAIMHATPDKLEATVRVDGIPVKAIEYRAKQTPTGVIFGTGSSRGFLKGAFLATMKTGHRGVYSRQRPSRSRKGKPRSSPALPIFERYGKPLSIIALRTEILKSALAVGEESFRKNLVHELRRGLAGIGAAA
jgi:hypothetical protein